MQKISLIASNLLYIFLLVNLEFSTVTLNTYTYIEEMCFRFCFFYCFQTFLIDFSLNIKQVKCCSNGGFSEIFGLVQIKFWKSCK